MRNSYIIRSLLLASIFLSCDPWFQYSPYEADVDSTYLETNAKNLALIQAKNSQDSKPFKVALLADPHYHYGRLDEAIDHINQNPEYAFAIVAGDLTENGLLQEYIYFHDAMSRLKVPYLAVIGNHDYLANGEMVYQQIYGPVNST
ncbi:MAG TPA: metallophosphoesterase, partial [Chryseosolibacter sp.]|nr:metallophosphoesterase [Chryseosolibacter sp.]